MAGLTLKKIHKFPTWTQNILHIANRSLTNLKRVSNKFMKFVSWRCLTSISPTQKNSPKSKDSFRDYSNIGDQKFWPIHFLLPLWPSNFEDGIYWIDYCWELDGKVKRDFLFYIVRNFSCYSGCWRKYLPFKMKILVKYGMFQIALVLL